jgi:hypothetical protein
MSSHPFTNSSRFRSALAAIDEANAQDPQTMAWNGRQGARELLFSQRVYEWVLQLDPSASEPLLLAARSHTLRRWEIARSGYEMNRRGYHAWRNACAEHHAQVARVLLGQQGYDDDTLERVAALILKEHWPADPDARTLEDADCLAFLEMKLEQYAGQWEQDKAVQILKRSLKKMTPRAREIASGIPFSSPVTELVQTALHQMRSEAQDQS